MVIEGSPTASFTSNIIPGSGLIDDAQQLPLTSVEHVVALRTIVRELALEIRLSLVDQTKLITAASELARNTLKYGGGGIVHAVKISDGLRRGVGLSFVDTGPGIMNIEQAMTDGYSSGGGLGLGLGGSKRLADEFELLTVLGEGTSVTIIKWGRV
ncbi:MAG TPA: ATP-binding protein [Herbaspirillum sp.]